MKFTKKNLIAFLSATILTAFQIPAYASAGNYAATYVLLSGEGIMEYDDNFDFNGIVDNEKFDKIYSSFFTHLPSRDSEQIKNRDAVFNLANESVLYDSGENTITAFKDYGLIDEKYRDSYNKLCNVGYLNDGDEFLDSDHALRYKEYFRLLSFYEENFMSKYHIETVSGKVGECTSKGDKIIIEVFSGSKTEKMQFGRNEKFPVYKDSELKLYDYNIKRDDNVIFYSKDNKIIFAEVVDKDGYLSDENQDIFRAQIYLYDESGNRIILKDTSSKSYRTYTPDDDIIIRKGNNTLEVSALNMSLLDIPCYIIADTGKNSIKFIYTDN